jgi:hypothetical protein
MSSDRHVMRVRRITLLVFLAGMKQQTGEGEEGQTVDSDTV